MITVQIRPRSLQLPSGQWVSATDVIIVNNGRYFATRYPFFLMDNEDNRLFEAQAFYKRRQEI